MTDFKKPPFSQKGEKIKNLIDDYVREYTLEGLAKEVPLIEELLERNKELKENIKELAAENDRLETELENLKG